MEARKGNLSISSENIFPIIKKWVYSDHDIFAREMISNGCDAITKLQKLEVVGEYQFPEGYKPEIHVIVNPEEKTLQFLDDGIGMTADEVEKDIVQIAFSGAEEFLEKYKDKTTEDDIIGHFGLGFYSAFMVADEVEIDTLSYEEGATPVHWVSNGGIEYEMDDGKRTEVGTTVTLHLNEDSLEFCNEYRMDEVLTKYCGFMPVPIYLEKANAETEYETIDESDLRDDDIVVEHVHVDAKMEEQEDENGEKKMVEVEPAKEQVKIVKRPVPINDIHPLWEKNPSDCTPEEYKEFYRKVFNDYKEPLFWIHLNMDYPFNLKGILYFPRINTEYDSIEGTIKLYNNQVFIADNIKEVVPEYLQIMKGVIDCPDLPLNVSRSALQNDGFVQKISDYISKKVADKLIGMCKTQREEYEKYWDDIGPFIKYGCLKDEKFAEKMKDYILFKNIDGKYLTLDECIAENTPEEEKTKASDAETGEAVEAEVVDEGEEAPAQDTTAASESEETAGGEEAVSGETAEGEEAAAEGEEASGEEEPEEPQTTIYYVTDEVQQSQYINLFRKQGQDAVILDSNIDSPFISQLEQQNPNLHFMRIDADVTASSKEEVSEEEKESFKAVSDNLTEIFRKELGNDQLKVQVEKLKDDSVASMITLSEEGRRMQEMLRMYGMSDMDLGGDDCTLILNANHPLVKYVEEHKDGENVSLICKQLYDQAMLANQPLSPEEMTEYVQRSNEIMMLLTK